LYCAPVSRELSVLCGLKKLLGVPWFDYQVTTLNIALVSCQARLDEQLSFHGMPKV